MTKRSVLRRVWPMAFLLTHATVAPAQSLRFLDSSALGLFRENDYELMTANAQKVLGSEDSLARSEWNNPKTGSSGVAEILGQFTATDGAPCKRLYLLHEAGGRKSRSLYSVCKYPGRGWLLHPDAQPANPSKPDEPAR